MAEDKPSLTPHRDQVERINAKHLAAGPAIGWQGQLFRETSLAVHLVIADARDRGVDEAELRSIAPKLLYIMACQIAGAFGKTQDFAPVLLGAAMAPEAQLEPTRKTSEPRARNAGGRA
jgi:hypothetical protein